MQSKKLIYPGLEIKKKNVWPQICDQLQKFGRNFENFSREINWGHLFNKLDVALAKYQRATIQNKY